MSENAAKIRVTAQDDTKAGLDSAKRNFAGLKGGISEAADGVDGFRTAVTGAVAALGVTAFAGWVKGAIDSADALNDLSEQTGIAASKLSEYQYAAQMSGTSIDTLSTGFKELAKGIAANDDALKSMGVATRDAAGNLRGTDQVLEDVADKFARYENGAAKSALAMQLFGKAGQEMIPFLNNGKAGLAELTGEAQAFGVVMGDDLVAAAAGFNDNLDRLKTASGGYAGQLAGELMPALGVVTDSLLGTAQGSGVLQAATSAMATGLKALVSVGYGVAHVFTQIGDGFGALAAAAAAALSGNWAQAKQIIADSGDQMAARDAALAGKIEKIWSDVPKAVEKSANDAADKAGKAQAPVVAKAKENANATKSAYDTLLESMRKQLMQAERLTAVEKLSQELSWKKYATLSQGQREHLQSLAQEIDDQKRLQQQAEDTAKWLEEGRTAQAKSLQDLQEEYKKAAREVETFGLSRGQIAERDLQLLQEQIDTERALNAEIGVGGSQYLSHLEKQLSLRQQIVAETAKLDTLDAGKKAAEEAAREWQKTVDTIDGTFHDAFTDMLKQGEADWESFADSLATTFKSAVADEIYKMTLKPLVLNVVGSFSGAGAPAVPGADGQSLSVSNGFGVLSGVQAAYGAVNGGIANAASSFATSGMGQYLGLSTVTPAGYTMGPPTAAGAYGYTAGGPAMTSSGSAAVGAAGWISAILAAIYTGFEWQKRGWFNDNSTKGYLEEQEDVFTKLYSKHDRLFGNSRFVSTDAGGIQGVLDTSGFTGDRWQQFSQRGGTFRSDKRWTDTFELDSDIDSYLDGLMRQTVSQLQAIGKTLDVETVRAVEGFSHQFSLQLSENGSWEKAGEKIAGEMAKVSDELVKSLVPGLADLSLFGETATQTFTRLGQEVAVTDAILLAMGKNAAEAFGGVGLASIAAREHLIDLAGGLDALASKAQSFYANFYSSGEQVQLAATQAQKVLTEGFAELGQGIPATREAFRALVESQDLSTESGRKLWNSLLDLSDEFDTVQKLADTAAESLKAAKQSQATLFDTFASDTQKLDAAKKLVSDTFASIGESVPKDAAAFLQLAQSIDPATEAGQGFVAALAKVSNAFAYVQTAAATAAQVAKDAAETARQTALNNANAAARGYFANLDALSNAASLANDGQAAIDRMFGAVEDGALNTAQMAADAAANAAQAWKSASQSIKSALENIRTGSLSGLSPEARYRLLQSQFSATSAAAQSGDSEAAGKLGQIATDFLDASRDYNASSEAFQADRAAADAALSKSLSYASTQASLQDTIAKASRDAVSQLQTLNTSLTGFAAKALELLQKSYGGADRGTATGAVQKLADIQSMVDKWFNDTTAGFSQDYAGGKLTRLGDGFAQFDAGGNSWYLRAGESALDLAKRVEAFRVQWGKDFGVNLPSYAVGTPFVPEDQIAQIHQGEMIIPASVAAQLRTYGIGGQPDNGLQAEILAELRTTRQGQQQSYGAMQQQLAASNAKLAAVERRLAAMEDQARLQRAGS